MQSAIENVQNFQTPAIAPSSSTKNDASNSPTTSAGTATESTSEDPFMSYLKQSLGKFNPSEVNEEEVYSSLIAAQLNKKDPALAEAYQQQVTDLSQSMVRANGTVPEEDVAKAALKALVDAGKVTEADAAEINGEAFAGAQLDTNNECLYDGRGTTRAVASAEEAMFKVQSYLDSISSGTAKVAPRSLDVPSNQGTTPGQMLSAATAAIAGSTSPGATSDSSAATTSASKPDSTATADSTSDSSSTTSDALTQLSWKATSTDGNAAVVLPSRLSGNVKSVGLYDENGKLLEDLSKSSATENGQLIYRAKHAGSTFGKHLQVLVKTIDDQQLVYGVSDGGTPVALDQDTYSSTLKAA